MIISTNINAGQRLEFYEPGDFFRLLGAVGPLDVTYYRAGKEIAKAEGIGEGYAEKFERGEFDRFAITSATAQAIQFVVRLGNVVSYDTPPNGDVTITNTGGAFTQAAANVTNASAQLLAAKATRRYLLIQNNDVNGDVFVNLTGAAATTANGIKIGPGGSYECQGYAPTGAVTAIGSIAANANVIVVEG